MTRLCLLGSRGMFGTDAVEVFSGEGFRVTGFDLPEVDVTDRRSLSAAFESCAPEVVVNAAAFTDVDGAESRREEAFRINETGAERVAEACRERGAFLVTISTDYVFPGTNPDGYAPDHPPGPAVNAYGESKLAGEIAVARVLEADRYLVCRTQWLYGRHGRNFVDTIAGLAAEREEIRVVDDQWGAPTHTHSLARQIAHLVRTGSSGVAHAVGGEGPITWYRFAREIVDLLRLGARVVPCSSSAFPRPARRPAHAWLRNTEIPSRVVGNWKDDLTAYLVPRGRRTSGQ